MKKLASLLILLLFVNCKKNEEKKEALYPEPQQSAAEIQIELGQSIFDGKGNCFACHKPDQKIIGPSITEIAKIYKEQNGDMVAFLQENAKPIVDPSQYETMRTNFAITKNLTEEELKALEAYFYSSLK